MNISRSAIIAQIMGSLQLIRKRMTEGTSTPPFYPLTVAQGFLLFFIKKHEQASIKDIATRLFITSSAATQLVEGLTKKGYLVRRQDSADRRILKITLTKKGLTQLEKFTQVHLQQLSDILQPLSDQELAQYRDLHQKIIDSFQTK